MPPLLDERFWQDIRQGLTDAGNRGIVGGTLGAPVDLASGLINAALMSGGYLGNKLGLLTAEQMPQPIENPVGGSEWLGQKMQDAGMVSANRNPVAETLVGLLGPSAISKGGQAVWAMEQNAAKPSLLNDAMRGQLGAIVYHGSPHQFDRFDMSKIGTGEGAQAYGHGMYFAQEPQVAQQYAKNLANYADPRGARPLPNTPIDKQLDFLMSDYFHVHDVASQSAMRDFVKKSGEKANRAGDAEFKTDDLLSRYDALVKDGTIAFPKPNLYKVDLPDEHIARMLDWDKPLSQQPHIQSALEKAGVFTGKKKFDDWEALVGPGGVYVNPKDSAAKAYIALQQQLGAPAASELFRKAGIPGIRYFDGVSRAKGEGSYNYVVFDADLPKIIGHE